MRPPRKIVVLANTSESLSQIEFLLKIRTHCRIAGTTNSDEVVSLITGTMYDAVFIEHGCHLDMGAIPLRYRLSVVMYGSPDYSPECVADFFIADGRDWSYRVLDTVKLAVTRKRGPRKDLLRRFANAGDGKPKSPARTIPEKVRAA